LKINPEKGCIQPNESKEIIITLHVTRSESQSLIIDQDKLEDILIFRLIDGRDYFVSVTGDYLKSCMGASLQYLVTIPTTPIRFASQSTITSSSSSSSSLSLSWSQQQQRQGSQSGKGSNKRLSMPKELWRIVDFIFKRGMDEPGLFVTQGNPNQIGQIVECLDTGKEFSSHFSVHSMAEVLIRFLANLPEPVFKQMEEKYNDSMRISEFSKNALQQLPSVNYNVFIYIISFLVEVLRHPNNKLNSTQLVLIFSSCLMHAELTSAKRKPKAWLLLRHFFCAKESSS